MKCVYYYYECPKCGELTLIPPRHYRDGTSLYIHEQKTKMKPFPHDLILRSCAIKEAKS